jgi:flagellar export protein FliJ
MKRAILERLIDHSRRERDRVAAQAADARRASNQAADTLTTLRDYRREYDVKSPKLRQRAPVDPVLLRYHEAFVDRLEIALVEQRGQLVRLDETADAQNARLNAAQQRLKAFETLLERIDADTQRAARRAEQVATDEQAARILRTRESR